MTSNIVNLLFLATGTLLLVATCTAMPDIHRQMTSDQLRSVFHVEHIDDVPQYELVTLTHHTQHSVRRRSVENTAAAVNASADHHHVKKDLTKSSYYSYLKKHGGDGGNGANSIVAVDSRELLRAIKEHKVSLEAFGDVLNLTLKPTQGLFREGPESLKMFTAESDPKSSEGVDYEEVAESSEHIGEVFQDEQNMAAILMHQHKETGDLLMEGSIGHEMVIKPLPESLINKDTVSEDGHVHHIVFKRKAEEDVDQMSDFAYMEPDRLQKRYRRSTNLTESDSTLRRSKRNAPYIIYPEILVIVDYDGYRLHGGDNFQVKRYFIAFWNGVDLRYRLLKAPRVRISIAGIIISRGRDATPYLERNRVGRDAIDSAAALTDMGKYLFRERRLPVYDIAVAITKLDLCRRNYPNSICNRGTAGFAYVGGACVVNKRLEKVNSVAIIEDTGGFSGIIVAAHEVGHLLGAVHDGSPPPSYLGGPGAQQCRWEDGFIMSDLRHTARGFQWSGCTIQSFYHFLNGDTASCLYNTPHQGEALGRALPGTLLSLDAQCRRDRGTSACFTDERVCAQLFCFDPQSGFCVAYRPAAEGSACGVGYHCLDGRCVAGNYENVIPDFSQRNPNFAYYNNNRFRTDPYSLYDEEGDGDDEATQPSFQTTEPTQPPATTTRATTVRTTRTASSTSSSASVSTSRQLYNSYANYLKQTTRGTTKSPFQSDSIYTNQNTRNYQPTKTPAFVYNKFAITTTKNPYNFEQFFAARGQSPRAPAPPAQNSRSGGSSSSSGSYNSAGGGGANRYNRDSVSYTGPPTRHPIFDVYLPTTKQPVYDYSNNYLGANSQTVNATVAKVQTPINRTG